MASSDTSLSIRFPTRLDVTIMANIRDLIPNTEEDEQHLYDEYENLPILHFDSRQVDEAKRAIQEFIWNTFAIRVFKNDVHMIFCVPPGTVEQPHGVPHRVSFDSPFIEVFHSFQLPMSCNTLRMEAKRN